MHQDVGILADGAAARRVDQEAFDRFGVGDEVLKILQETWTVAVQCERMREGREGGRERGRFGRALPCVKPAVMILRWTGRGEQPDQELHGRHPEIRTRPVDADDRIGVERRSDLGRCDHAPDATLPEHRQPGIIYEVEHVSSRRRVKASYD